MGYDAAGRGGQLHCLICRSINSQTRYWCDDGHSVCVQCAGRDQTNRFACPTCGKSMLKQGGDALGPQLRASPLGIGRWSWESPWPRDPRLSEPVRDFCVAMPRLSIEALDTEALPNPVKLALAFLRAVCPREVVPDVAVAQLPPLLPPQLARNKGRRTLVLDLDETLVHCHPSLLAGSPPPALELYLDAACPPLHAHIYVRPFAQLLLELAAHVFEVVVFTASAAVYADKAWPASLAATFLSICTLALL